ncbi:MAG: hypothetical protein HWN65_15890 [Candidatus Helarchaeota archaeon]|nr:hypothetical protein [Candidatus Helarchaeota archaeon]
MSSKLRSHFPDLDELLGGGFEPGEIYLLYGPARPTETILFTLTVSSQLPETKGGLDSPVLLVDNANIFNPDAVTRVAIALELNVKEVLSRIFVARALDWMQFSEIVEKLETLIAEKKARLVLIAGLVGFASSVPAQASLAHITTRLKMLAKSQGIIVITTASEHDPSLPLLDKTIRVSQDGAQVAFKL